MKLKTLLLVLAILCVSLFVVACGDEDTTTAGETPDGTTTAATTTKETTKKTTKVTSDRRTTTVATTTIVPAELIAKLPAKLPDNSTYDIHTRIGLDAEADYLSISGNYQNLKFTADGAIFGNGLSMEVNPQDQYPRVQAFIDLLDPFAPEGVKGIMWYVDFSAAVPVSSTPMCTSTTINVNNYRANHGGAGTAKGYYYKDGAWIETTNVNACRMEIPDNFKGWVYVPLSEYWKGGSSDASGDLFDGTTKLGLSNVIVTNIRLYTDGYEMVAGKPIIFDEVLYVK